MGEMIRDDGVVMALRSYDRPDLAIVEQSVDDCMKINHTFDEKIYAPPGGRVASIRIHHHLDDTNIADKHMDGHTQMYDQANRQFCKQIVAIWTDLKKKTRNNVKLSERFGSLITQCLSVTTDDGPEKLHKVHQKAPLNAYRIEITFEYEIIPTTGFKLTDTAGG